MQPLTLTLIIIGAISLLAIVILIYWQKKNSPPVIEKPKDIFVDINNFVDKVIDGDAKIVSVHPRETTGVSPDETVVKMRLAIKEGENFYETHDVKWKIKYAMLTELRQGRVIPVKIYGDLIFPLFEGAALIAPSPR